MEISLNPELMKLLVQFLSTFTRMQFQYLIAIIPGAIIFIMMILLYGTPIVNFIMRQYLLWRLNQQNISIITMIHTQPTSIFDLFTASYINLSDAHSILKALRKTPRDRRINLILHTPGGLVIAAEQIAKAIKKRGDVHAYIPQYAMSGGTLIALACDTIHLGENALLGPLDPQLNIGLFETYPAISILTSAKQDNVHRDDKTLILADIAQKAVTQIKQTVTYILKDKYGEKASCIASQLCDGNWTHDFGIDTRQAKELGLDVDNEITHDFERLIELYPSSSNIVHKKGKKKDTEEKRITISLLSRR